MIGRKQIIIIILLIVFFTFFSINSFFPTDSEDNNSIGLLHENRQVMGTIVTIEVIGPKNNHQTVIDQAFQEMNRIEDLMSTYDQDSEINRLNKEGYIVTGSHELISVINQSNYYSEISNGAFDITILPLLNLWKTKVDAGELPTAQEINDTLNLVNYENITIQNDTIAFAVEGMAVTLGGIAKGYAVDRAVSVLKDRGYENGFVNAGGDGSYFGTKPDGSFWRVGLRNPDNKTNAIVILEISNMSVATSGNYERYFNESARLSHISDPRTGYSSQNLISATVIANSAMEADALATAIFVLGPIHGMELIEKIDNSECLVITPERQILKSSGFSTYESEPS